MWYRGQRQVRSKIAIDLSHFRLMEHIAASNLSTVILEDDAQLTGERWLPDLLTALQELPEVRMGRIVFKLTDEVIETMPAGLRRLTVPDLSGARQLFRCMLL
jgi:GR25 family glycosyltransferase involved in LPS biosynthesis